MGYCIYCGTTKGALSKEHIVPYALNGNLVLPDASCEKCSAITKKYEDTCLRVMLKPLRTRLRMQSRRPKQEYIDMEIVNQEGRRETLPIHNKDFPVPAYGISLPIAGIICGQAPSDLFSAKISFGFNRGEAERFVSKQPVRAARVGYVNVPAFMRMLAKIGYSYAAAEIGTSTLHPMLVDMVLARGTNSEYLSYLVGGEEENVEQTPNMNNKNRIELWEYTINNVVYTIVKIQLIGFLRK
jgi:hypothetical protein